MASLLGISNCNQTSKSETNSDDSGIEQCQPTRVKKELGTPFLQNQTGSTKANVGTNPLKMAEKVIPKFQSILSEDANLDVGKLMETSLVSTSGSGLCNVCSKMFSNKKTLRVHLKMHDEDIRCHICCKFFTNIYILKYHILTHTQKKTECQQCSQSVFSLKGHMQRVHSGLGAKYVTCTNCGVEVKGIGKHEKICRMTNEEKAAYRENLKASCQKCSKVLANKHKLARHIQSAHSKERLFECKFCDHKVSRSDNLDTHVKNNHSKIKQD